MRLGVELAGAAQFETIEELVQQPPAGRARRRGVRARASSARSASSTCTALTGAHPELGAVFAVDELSTDVLQQALRAGARDAVVLGGEASLHQSVDRVGRAARRRVDASVPQSPATGPASPAGSSSCSRPRAAWARPASRSTSRSRWRKRSTEPVVLVDGDLQFGDVVGDARPPAADTPCSTPRPRSSTATWSSCRRSLDKARRAACCVLPAPIEPMPTDALLPGEMVEHLRGAAGDRRPRRSSTCRRSSTTTCSPHRGGRRGAARRQHGHPEHQEPEDRDAGARPRRRSPARSSGSCSTARTRR